MRNQKLIESLDIEYTKFIDKLKEINFYKSMICNAKKETLKNLRLQKEKSIKLAKDIPDFELFKISNLVYENIQGRITGLGFVDKNIDEIIESVEYQHNKQYQWFLVDIFELYIKFVENSHQIIEQIYSDLFIFSKKDKKAYYNIIKKLKEKDTLLNQFESGKFHNRDINYNHYMEMIKALRNAIVHQQGSSTNVNEIYTEMEKYSKDGLDGNFEKIISIYFGTGKFSNMICLNEIFKSENRCSDRLGYLIGIIIVHSELILNSYKRILMDIEDTK